MTETELQEGRMVQEAKMISQIYDKRDSIECEYHELLFCHKED